MDLDDGASDMEDLPRYLKGTYKILSLDQIRECQEDDISNVSSVLSISRAEAMILLLHFKWDVQIITEKWFTDATKVRAQLRLIESPPISLGSPSTIDMTCEKCSAHVPEYLGSYIFCSHKFCTTCWQEFIGKSLRDNRPILRCPAETCCAAVNQDIISLLVSEADQKLHNSIVLRSYLAKKGKRCPTPGCNHAVLLESGDSIYQFTCKCHYSFCYKCLKEAHHPICCALVETWRREPLKQSRNWQVAYIRNCPKCNQSLESKSWSKQMQCSVCSFNFCWTCLGSWFENGHRAGEQYNHICPPENLSELAAMENTRAKATNMLLRYQGCFTHFSSHDADLEQVLLKLRTMQHNELKVLAEKQGIPLEEVSFVRDAWLQVAECKRVFKWACVYEFYFFVFQEDRKPLYENLIRQGAFVMDQLCIVASELRKFIGTDAPPTAQFEDFRQRLVFKTSVARNFFENMETAIRCEYLDMEILRLTICSRELIEMKPATDVGTSTGVTELAAKPSERPCPHCSFPSDNTTTVCVMCYH
ncbi:putative E3 ubiquitin-protein ligase ARI8 isoform X2 [Silene latifolia]